MILTLEQIKSITSGAVNVTYEDGMFRFYRFFDGEVLAPEETITQCTAGIYQEFTTDAQILNMSVNTWKCMDIRSFFSFDIFVDDKLVGHIKNFENSEMTGAYSSKEFKTGEFTGFFDLGTGEKTVKIVMPYSVIAGIENIELKDASYITPVKRKKILVAYGDSITQGYDAQHPSCTYAMMLADALDAEIFSKGIGGDVFDYRLVDASCHIKPDYVTVAYGTNDWTVYSAKIFRQNVADFMKSVSKIYPDSTKIVITPIWRKYHDIPRDMGSFDDMTAIIVEEAKKYSDFHIVSGWELVPNDENLFGDLALHPNDEGFSYYAKNLKEKLKGLVMFN